jgi:hypothetical protein
MMILAAYRQSTYLATLLSKALIKDFKIFLDIKDRNYAIVLLKS